jgi:diaminohydroxyphosphoribosylaminopyrimidine deaminase/5-amino-6-(5-phosphoribosylamino)uracil reductase
LPLVRVVLDEALEVSTDSQLVRTADESPLLIFAGDSVSESKAGERPAGVEVIRDASGGRNLREVLDELGGRRIQSLLIEGGASVAGQFLDEGLVNKVSFFIAPKIIGGRDAPSAVQGLGAETLADAIELEDIQVVQRGPDVEFTGYPIAKGKRGEG